MIDTIIYVMVVLTDTTVVEKRFTDLFEEADRKFTIEMLRQASKEAAEEAAGKRKRTKILELYRKED